MTTPLPKPVTSLGLSDDEHRARVEQARADIIAAIMAEDTRVTRVEIDEAGTWRAIGGDGELCRGRSGASLRAQLPYIS